MGEYRQHTICPVSGSTRLKPLKGYEQSFLVKSQPLGFVFSARIPTTEELVAHYDRYPRNDYLSPVTVRRYHELLDDFEKYRKKNRILDVGCGIGYFLIEAKKRGWEVYGTEYTDEAIRICREAGISMRQGKLDPQWYGPGMFDIVVSIEVIEHINNPREEVKNIHSILRPGGLFYFTTPNFNALERYFLKERYNVIQYPEHLCYYTRRTINYLLVSAGFKRRKLVTTGISITRIRTSLGSSEEYISSSSTDEKLRSGMESNRLLKAGKKVLNGLLNVFGVGSSLKGWYIKK